MIAPERSERKGKKMQESLKKRVDTYLSKDTRSTFYERVQYLMECEEEYRRLPPAERYAETFYYILDHITPVLNEGELLRGTVAEKIPTEQEREYVEELTEKWWGKCPEEIQKDVLWTYSFEWLRRRAPWFYSFGHLAFDWEEILSLGIGGLRTKAMELLESERYASASQVSFLKGIIRCYDAFENYIRRYASVVDEAEERDSLLHISTGAPRTLKEALQLLWLIAMPSAKVVGCGVLCFGRMDQYLYPFYQRDKENGLLSEKEAQELLEEFFFKNNEIMSLTDHMSNDAEGTSGTLEVIFDDPNYVIIGGLLNQKESGVNDLSWIMVRANRELGLKNPFMVVRYHEGIEEGFWREVCDAMGKNTTIVVYNDDTMIPALKSCGVEEPEVYDYGFFGCNDPIIPAYEGGLRQFWFNLAKPLELCLNSGDFPMLPRFSRPLEKCQYSLWDRMTGLMTGAYYGKKTKPAAQFESMDDVIDAYREQVRFLLRDYKKGILEDLEKEKEYNKGHLRIEDCFLKGTVENALDWNNGGTKYHKYVVQGTGLATVVDSLYAIENIVFDTKEFSMQEFAQIVASNFKGHKDLQERLQNRLSKFGNDDPRVDKYAKIVVDIFCDELAALNTDDCLYSFWPTLSSDRDFVKMGLSVGATPDGRGEREPLSENQSPVEGKDINGVTALLNSVSKVPFYRITGGPLNVKIHPNIVKGEEGLRCFAALLKTYMQQGGMQVQVNILDKDMLLEAQRNPMKHKGLCVRVTGYSAFFVQMGKKAQDELIQRTELQ